MKIISWNLLRLIGASADEVAHLVEREQPDVLLMQEATQAIDRLPDLVGGHYLRRLQPGRVHGLAVWTRRAPVQAPKVVPLPQGAMFRRIGMVVDMGDFAVGNVHLSHGQVLNRRQLWKIAAALPDRAAVLGDFNLVGPCLLGLPALVPHGFRFAPDIHGTVLTVLERHLAQLLQTAAPLAARLQQPLALHWAGADATALAQADAVADAVAALRSEFHGTGGWRDLALDAALLHLAVLLGRLAPPLAEAAGTAAAPPARALGHVQRYRALVELRFRQQPTLAALAGSLGITPTQLNRVCHQVLGHSALGVVHDRLVLEAQRDLAYTTLAIKQIALGLGFADAGYFSRFFQRHTGHSPTAWRALAAR